MATLTIDGAISKIKGILQVAADDAQGYMSGYISSHAKQGYAKGNLAKSINQKPVGESAISVGTDVEYAYYVDQGRGAITKEPGYLQYYDKKYGHWVKTHHVKGMSGIHFIDETAKYIKDKYG